VNPLASILSFSAAESGAPAETPVTVFVVLGVVGSIGGILAGVASIISARRAGQINDAVNHRSPDEPRLLDIVKGMDEKQDLMAEKLDRHLGWHAGHDARARSGSDYLDEGV
jgi:hypothetical protein